MQIPENPSNDDIRAALIQLREELGQKVDRLDYKFDAYQKGTDGMVRMATTIIIATASVVVLSSLSPAVTAIITALYSANAH
ncbi:MAG: hypothetical protein EWV49_09675 [Microcystis aeruginosa Ma_QC_Ch_20071001_S25]|jgi:hypothetical protein|uniref:Uncharacterized protein n=5 Tax=Microcystis TaxID=1125 RepID=A0A0A1VZ22_MICAE|nr:MULTISPECIES: hypothetical protein [Microcystis]MCA2816819.1 hypothetical protein [Microcystis sp. M085S1]MCA2857270.1 hypothetical protein [Microcystis sp. M065S1]MCZ8053320.1 hypothetical protein [Microcystis sp. LE19-12.2C]TRT96123.1 MAG: hypothetical protein EWV65_14025 [Microcystis flos-aquae Ma_QC_C_20070823_S18D]TRU50213.1 MAG: hypothetical protein EWV49_09675 [Microcystis aeruginosa Ma_QC_Ch_20071001_S25]TRU53761.1 MAG: hypothetical protein EWV57_03170 [Microcystis aeruginosa Ma_QC